MRKRHEVDTAELDNWRVAFDTSSDYFDDLDGLDPHGRQPPHGDLRGQALADAETHFLAAMYDAWRRLGQAFLEETKGPLDKEVPFALFAFGDPAKPKLPRRSLATLRAAHFAQYWEDVRGRA